jgi:hypothetical protein
MNTYLQLQFPSSCVKSKNYEYHVISKDMNGSHNITGTQQNQSWYFQHPAIIPGFICVYFQTKYSASLIENFCIMLADVNVVDCVWNVKAHVQKADSIFWRNRRVHLNPQGRQFSRLLAAKVCASAVVMLDKPCSEVVWRVLAIHSIHQFPLHFPSHASPCAITFQLDSSRNWRGGTMSQWSCYCLVLTGTATNEN